MNILEHTDHLHTPVNPPGSQLLGCEIQCSWAFPGLVIPRPRREDQPAHPQVFLRQWEPLCSLSWVSPASLPSILWGTLETLCSPLGFTSTQWSHVPGAREVSHLVTREEAGQGRGGRAGQ